MHVGLHKKVSQHEIVCKSLEIIPQMHTISSFISAGTFTATPWLPFVNCCMALDAYCACG